MSNCSGVKYHTLHRPSIIRDGGIERATIHSALKGAEVYILYALLFIHIHKENTYIFIQGRVRMHKNWRLPGL